MSFLYVCEDLLSDQSDTESHFVAASAFTEIMSLNKPAEAVPEMLEALRKAAHQSLVVAAMSRACIVGLMMLEAQEVKRICYTLNRYSQSLGHDAVYIALERDRDLKQYLLKYGNIHKEFRKYDEILANVWETQAPFERSIFVMMPFRRGMTFRGLTETVKEACKDRGYKAIRVDDNDRQLAPTLWDNLVANMLSCKYGIAIYVSEKTVDLLEKSEPKMFPNPNVALEFGFFSSRGQKILLLKESKSPLPTDLEGFLWKSFDIEEPVEDVYSAVNEFLDNIESENS